MHESMGFPQFSHAAISSVAVLISRSYILTVKVIILLHCKNGFRRLVQGGAVDPCRNARDSLLSSFCPCYSLKLYEFVCPSCSFESRNLAGTPDGDDEIPISLRGLVTYAETDVHTTLTEED